MSLYDAEKARVLLETSYGEVRRIAETTCARKGIVGDRRKEFASFVSLKLLENDCHRIRQFGGRSSLRTYLTTVIERLFVDFHRKESGTRRPSRRAKALGATAERLERLFGDGLSFDEAFQRLRTEGLSMERDELWRISESLPRREKPQFCDLELLSLKKQPTASTNPEEEALRAEQAQLRERLERAIREALTRLPPEHVLVVRMWFDRGMTAPEIARALHLGAREIYAIVQKTMTRVRRHLAGNDLANDAVRDLVHSGNTEMDIFRNAPEV